MTAGYNVLEDHTEIFLVPQMMTDDKPLFIGMTEHGSQEGKTGWAYTIATGPYENDVEYEGHDLFGWGDAGEMAATLMGFLSAYAEGNLQDSVDGRYLEFDGDTVAVGNTAEFIVDNGERFGIASHDLEEGYAAWSDETAIVQNLPVHESYYTGKEPE